MITPVLIERLLASAPAQQLRDGTRYAEQARVGTFIGSSSSVSTVVRGRKADHEVVLWSEGAELRHRCQCAEWRDPCRHAVAAALVLRQWITRPAEEASTKGRPPAKGRRQAAEEEQAAPATGPRRGARRAELDARARAILERTVAGRRERMRIRMSDEPPILLVQSGSGFEYRVHVRGSAEGPHGCDCPDFEANRLHYCKHVARVRTKLKAGVGFLPAAWRKAARRARVFLHLGEVVEPRLLGSPQGRGAPAVRTAFDAQGEPHRPLATDVAELHAWLERFGDHVEPEALAWLARRVARKPVLPDLPPSKLLPRTRLKPHDYQVEGALFLARAGRALLADEMGLGKTGQAILAAVALRKAAAPVEHVTIVCPASLRGGWQEEIRRWVDEEALLLEGNAPTRAGIIAQRPQWLVTHYEQVLRDHQVHAAHAPDLLILDEAQRVKGLAAQTARAVKAIDARHVFALTGTPLENRLEEAYAIAQLVDQRLLPPLWQVEEQHFVRDGKGGRVIEYRGLDVLRARLSRAFLRRRKEDVALQLPERVRSVVFVPMHPEAEPTYKDVMAQVARILHKKVILPADLDRIQRLLVIARRACNGPHMLGLECDDRKVPKLQELRGVLEDLCLGERRKLVVFSEWTDMTSRVELLCRRLKIPTFHLHGGVALKARPGLIAAFREQPGAAVFISTDAGGVGLNLQVADAVVNLDVPWNPARLEQRVERVHRIGSRNTVNEILIVTKGTVEHGILLQHATKRNVLANVWGKSGDDVIQAPGGSGAFRDMVKALLETSAPDEVRSTETAEEVVLPPAAHADGAVRAPVERVAEPVPVSAGAGSGGPGTGSSGNGGLDVAALGRALAAVAPTLPADHRQSLAAVFRAMAAALDG